MSEIKNIIKEGDYDNEITQLVVPHNIVTIDKGAFENFNELEVVKIKDNVKEIKMNAFKNCNNLKEIYLSDSILEIGKHAFYGINVNCIIYCSKFIRNLLINSDALNYSMTEIERDNC